MAISARNGARDSSSGDVIPLGVHSWGGIGNEWKNCYTMSEFEIQLLDLIIISEDEI